MTDAISLRYLLSHPTAIGFSCEDPRWLWLALIPALMLAFGLRHRRARLATYLRALALLAGVAGLAGLKLTARLPDDRLTLVAVIDRSESIDAEGRRWQERYLAEVGRGLAPRDRLSMVVFGAEPRLSDGAEWREAGVEASATDIGRALDAGLAAATGEGERRIVLLSDGHQTRGDAAARIAQARRDRVKIFIAVPPHAGGMDVGVEKLSLPDVVTTASPFQMQVTVSNRGPRRRVSLGLEVDAEPIGEDSLLLQPGLNAVTIPFRLEQAGTHRIEVVLQADEDLIAGNDRRAADVTVVGPLPLLLVSPHRHSALQLSLERRGIAVTARSPGTGGLELRELRKFAAVVLEDLPAQALDSASLSALERFVSRDGGALVFAGGELSYGDPAWRDSRLAPLLPVTFEPHRPRRPQRPPLGLFVIIDRSNSMGYHFQRATERSDTESKLVYAQRAALAVLAQLKSNDYIGVIAFDATPHEISPLTLVGDARAALTRDIPRLQPDGGTDFHDALDSATAQLAKARVGSRHVILLTDGDTNRSESHESLIARLERDEVSVTTIRIGEDRANLKLLTAIAARTGGEFYHVESAEELPELMLRDTGQALARVGRSGEVYVPRVKAQGQALVGFEADEFPDLYGYAFARSKDGADVLLEVALPDRRDPLLAVWQYGLGRVVAFTASLHDDAGAWIGWNKLGKFWSQAVRWAARDHARRDYGVRARRAGGETTLEVRSFGDDDDTMLWARVEVDRERRLDLPLEWIAPRRFQGKLPSLPAGAHRVSIVERSGEREVGEQTHLVRFPSADEKPREEYFADKPDLPLLKRLAEETGGGFEAPIREIVDREPGSREAQQRLDWLWVPLAMLSFLAELTLRRLEWG